MYARYHECYFLGHVSSQVGHHHPRQFISLFSGWYHFLQVITGAMRPSGGPTILRLWAIRCHIHQGPLSIRHRTKSRTTLPSGHAVVRVTILSVTSHTGIYARASVTISDPVTFFLAINISPHLPTRVHGLLRSLHRRVRRLPNHPGVSGYHQ